jgi:hypothetical protein
VWKRIIEGAWAESILLTVGLTNTIDGIAGDCSGV